MNGIIIILLGIASIVVCFFSRMWSWIILVLPFIYLVSQAFLVKRIYKWKQIPELSEDANILFQKYGHYYTWPLGGRDFSSASSLWGMTGVVVAIIGLFFHFWWGLLLGVIAWFVSIRLGKFFNPSKFLTGWEKQAHEEIIFYLDR
jgi:hypothetical protein